MIIELKESNPSEVDIAVPLIYSSGPDAFEYVFKNKQVSAVDFLKHAFVREGGEFSFDNHYSLYADGRMVGIGSVFNAKTANGFGKADGLNILRFYKWKSPKVIKDGLAVERIIKIPVKNETAIAHLGILPELRGKGLGKQLIAGLMVRAEKDSYSRFILDVSEENPRAKVLYERLGFEVTKKHDSTLKNKFSYVPNHFRMELIE